MSRLRSSYSGELNCFKRSRIWNDYLYSYRGLRRLETILDGHDFWGLGLRVFKNRPGDQDPHVFLILGHIGRFLIPRTKPGDRKCRCGKFSVTWFGFPQSTHPDRKNPPQSQAKGWAFLNKAIRTTRTRPDRPALRGSSLRLHPFLQGRWRLRPWRCGNRNRPFCRWERGGCECGEHRILR